MNGDISGNFSIAQDGMLTLRGRICVPDVDDLRKSIMEEAHCSAYAMCRHLILSGIFYSCLLFRWTSGPI